MEKLGIEINALGAVPRMCKKAYPGPWPGLKFGSHAGSCAVSRAEISNPCWDLGTYLSPVQTSGTYGGNLNKPKLLLYV